MYSLPELDYDYTALSDYISGDIMKLHHSKHHQTYVDKLNQALAGLSESDKSQPIEQLICNLTKLPEEIQVAVRNNGGGHYNHSMFWQWMSPDGGGQPIGDIAGAMSAKYGSFQNFVDKFTARSMGVFGSGWCWLMPNMEIITTADQDSPLMKGLGEPLLGLDVWEHAYYLDYKNKRDDYIAAWWEVVDWDFVGERFQELLVTSN